MYHADPKHVSEVSLGETFVPDVTMTMDDAERLAERKQRQQQRASAQQEGAGAGNATAAPRSE